MGDKENYTKYEIARIISARALQLSMNAPILLKISKEKLEEINYDVIRIAEMEFEAGVLPFTIRRPKPLKQKLGFLEEVEEKEEIEEETKELVEETIEEMFETVEEEEREEEIKEEIEEGIE